MKPAHAILSLFLLLFGASAFAQDTFEGIISTILANSPQLESEKNLIKAQRLELSDNNSLSNPEVSFARVWGRHGIGNKLQLDVSQSFDWPGLYRARSKAAVNAVSAAEMLLLSNSLDISIQAKDLLLQLVYTRKQINLANEIQGYLDRLKQALDTAVDNGEATELDRRKIAIEQYKLDALKIPLFTSEQQIISELQMMCPAVKLNLDQINQYPIEQALTIDEYFDEIATFDPLISSQKFSVMQEEDNASTAKMSQFPSFSLGYQHQAEMGDRFNGFTASMSLPFFENRHSRSAAIARRDASEYSLQLTIAKKQAETQQALSDMEKWRLHIENYNRVFGDNAYPTLLLKAFQGGQINIIDFLSEVQYFCEATQNFLDADYNYHLAIAKLNKYSLLQLL